MSTHDPQQPGFGAPQGQPGYGGAPQGQPGYGAPQAQPGYGQPGQQTQPGYGQPQPGYGAPQGQPGYGQPQGQPGFGQHGQPGIPQAQPGFPQGQPGFPQPQGGWGSPQQSFGAPPRKSSTALIMAAVGGFVVVAILGVVLFLVVRGGDDQNVGPSPDDSPATAQPGDGPTTEANGEPRAAKGKKAGIEIANGIYVTPAANFGRETGKDVPAKGVLLIRKGGGGVFEGRVLLEAPGTSQADLINDVVKGEKSDSSLSNFKTGELRTNKPDAGADTGVVAVYSQTWSGDLATQNGSVKLVGFDAVIEHKEGITTVVRFYGDAKKIDALKPELKSMFNSVLDSQ